MADNPLPYLERTILKCGKSFSLFRISQKPPSTCGLKTGIVLGHGAVFCWAASLCEPGLWVVVGFFFFPKWLNLPVCVWSILGIKVSLA